MPRFFLEVAYKGTNFKGFQVQENAHTIQGEIEAALQMLHRQPFVLTGSSRTDAGVHALQNFFHFDSEALHPQAVYKLNAIISPDVVVKSIQQAPDGAHARFDAVARAYAYHIHTVKDPFRQGLSYYYPYRVRQDLLEEATAFLQTQTNFAGFSKSNTQVKNFECKVMEAGWEFSEQGMVFKIKANRFLRGMVRLLTGTLLKVGREKIGMAAFEDMFKGSARSVLSAPAEGLFLMEVQYPKNYFLHQA